MNEEFTCQARVMWRGKELHLNRIVAQIDLDGILPQKLISPTPMPKELYELNNNLERRRRFIDLLSAEFAHALIEALFKVPDNHV